MLSNSDYCGNFYNAMTSPWYRPPRPPHNYMMDTPPSSSREMRNKAEKQRRDRLNAYIGELATLVPMIARSAKRMDKTSILRLTATYLRIYQTFLNKRDASNMELPKHLDQFVLDQLVCDQLGGFLLILTTTGKIIFVSHTVEHLLGHLQTDLMGQSLFNITSPEDHDRLRTYLSSEGVLETEWRKYFNIHIKRAGPRSESAVYEMVKMMGMHKQLGNTNPNNSPSSSYSGCSGASTSSRELSTTFNNEILVFFVKLSRPEPLVDRLIEASKDEYFTRHLIDGRIVNCDQRISLVAGYMIDEVSGHSAFKYMHRDDVHWVMIALRQMYDRGESRGSSCYRLISRNGQFIYLRTFGYLEIDDQGIVESFVCINTLVSENEGRQLINEMKKRFSAIFANGLPNVPANPMVTQPPVYNNNNNSMDMLEDPNRVDQAVMQLMKNLPSPGGSDNRSTPSPLVNYQESQDFTNMTEQQPQPSPQPPQSVTANSPSPTKPFRIKPIPSPMNSVGKRPSTDQQHLMETNSNKRRKAMTPSGSLSSINSPMSSTSVSSPLCSPGTPTSGILNIGMPQLSPIGSLNTPYQMSPINNDLSRSPPSQSPDQSIYQHDHLLKHNV